MKEAENQMDNTQRIAYLQKAEQQLLADMPVIPIYFYTTQHLVNPKVSGWVDNIMDVHKTQYLGIN